MSRYVSLVLFLALALFLATPATTHAGDQTAPVIKAGPVTPATAVTSVARAPLTAEEKALRELEETSRATVEELVHSMAGLPDGPVLRALQRKVEEVKQEHRLEFLRLKRQFARQRGDLETAQECERLIDLILNPPKPVLTNQSRARERQREEGGQP